MAAVIGCLWEQCGFQRDGRKREGRRRSQSSTHLRQTSGHTGAGRSSAAQARNEERHAATMAGSPHWEPSRGMSEVLRSS